MIKIKEGDIVEIKWMDTCGGTGWERLTEADILAYEKSEMQIQSVGYVLRETKQSIAIVQNVNRPNKETSYSTNNYTQIPKFAIKSIKKK